jgi:hypothetical protein
MASTRTYPPLARTYRQSGALSNRPRTQHRPPCTASRENTVVASTLPTRSASRACPVRAVVGAILVIALPRFGRTPPPGANTRFAPTCATDRENVVLNEHILGSSTLRCREHTCDPFRIQGLPRSGGCRGDPRDRPSPVRAHTPTWGEHKVTPLPVLLTVRMLFSMSTFWARLHCRLPTLRHRSGHALAGAESRDVPSPPGRGLG